MLAGGTAEARPHHHHHKPSKGHQAAEIIHAVADLASVVTPTVVAPAAVVTPAPAVVATPAVVTPAPAVVATPAVVTPTPVVVTPTIDPLTKRQIRRDIQQHRDAARRHILKLKHRRCH